MSEEEPPVLDKKALAREKRRQKILARGNARLANLSQAASNEPTNTTPTAITTTTTSSSTSTSTKPKLSQPIETIDESESMYFFKQ